MARYSFRISYRKGTENARTDALSRRLDYTIIDKLAGVAVL